jgi:hypothetical protein
MRKIAFLIFFLLAISSVTFAQDIPTYVPGVDVLKIIFGPSVPPEWYQGYNVFQFLILPMVLIILVIYGIMSEIRIFKRGAINAAVAVIIGLIASYSGALVLVVRWTTLAAGIFGYVVFIILLFVGIIVFAVLKFRGWGISGGRGRMKFNTEILATEAKLVEWRDYLRTVTESGNTKGQAEAMKEITKLEKKVADLRNKAPPKPS